ncbi:MAG: hypothetical protein R3C14_52965 [Caldilineaceae bacterium]
MSQLTQSVLYYGKDEPLPEQIPLRAGPLQLLYENGDLRYIKLGDQELVRRLYVAIRDRNWGTVLPRYSNITVEIQPDSFEIQYDVVNQQGEIDFRWHGVLRGEANGRVTCTLDGAAHSTFLRNRIGFCLLHPMGIAGAPARIEHVDGSQETYVFPQYIAPQLFIDGLIKPVAPFEELRAVAHEVTPGIWAKVRFTGETFEMEDQRNWTDASYKTYGTPLRLPFPVQVEAGEHIAQAVTLSLQADDPAQLAALAKAPTIATPVTLTLDRTAPPRPLPALGLQINSHGTALNAQEIARLQALHLHHLRIDLHLAQADYDADLRRAITEANALGVGLEVALCVTDNATVELTKLTSLLAELQPPVQSWLLYHVKEKTTSERWITLARTILASYLSQARLGGGANAYFTELNCVRPPAELLDVVVYSVNPQVHAFDNSSLMETLAAQTVTVTSARQFCGDRPIAVTPVTLQPRFNPNATGPEPEPAPGELPSQVDVRQMSLFGAGWTLGSISALAQGGAQSVTYYETNGWRGVMERATGSPLPQRFQSIPGGVFPLYHVLADVGDFADGAVITTHSSADLCVAGLALHKDGQLRVLTANLTAQAQSLEVRGLPATVNVHILDVTNVEAAMGAPENWRVKAATMQQTHAGTLALELSPYAVLRIDGDLKS